VYVPDLTDGERAWSVASRMLQLRGDHLAGGIVLRRIEQFTGAEVCTWWIDGQCRLITARPDTPEHLPPPGIEVRMLEPIVAGLGLPFVTIDLVRRVDGVWRVVEMGDGQVSDRPSSTPAETLIDVLLAS
jgi:hypothetical protein